MPLSFAKYCQHEFDCVRLWVCYWYIYFATFGLMWLFCSFKNKPLWNICRLFRTPLRGSTHATLWLTLLHWLPINVRVHLKIFDFDFWSPAWTSTKSSVNIYIHTAPAGPWGHVIRRCTWQLKLIFLNLLLGK